MDINMKTKTRKKATWNNVEESQKPVEREKPVNEVMRKTTKTVNEAEYNIGLY